MSDERTNPPRRDDDEEPLEYVNREEDPDVDFDERDDFEIMPAMEDPDEDLEEFEAEAVEQAEAEPEPEPTPEPAVAAAAGTIGAAAHAEGDAAAEPPRTARPRGNGGGRKGPPLAMLAALALIVVVALFMFWPRGGGVTEVGEGQSSVLTLPDTTAAEHAAAPAPRSGDVDLDQELSPVVPEESDGAAAAAARVDLRREAESRSAGGGELAEPEAAVASGSAPVRERPAETTAESPTRATAASSTGEPSHDGAWAIQVGSFGDLSNAERLAGRLRDKGHRVVIQDLSSGGGTVHKVWVGYFATRAEAQAYAAAHAADLGAKPYITHR